MNKLRPLLLLLTVLLLAGCGGPHQFTGSVINPPKPLTDFTLPDQNGQPFQLSAQRDDLVLLYFGYTQCPDYCPTTLGAWKQVKQMLGDNADSVRFVLVSVDPERDTEPVLKSYVERFDPSFIGLRPTLEQVGSFSGEYGFGVEVVQTAAGEHQHDPTRHGTYSYLVDQTGQLRLLFPYDTDPRRIADDIKAVLAQS